MIFLASLEVSSVAGAANAQVIVNARHFVIVVKVNQRIPWIIFNGQKELTKKVFMVVFVSNTGMTQ